MLSFLKKYASFALIVIMCHSYEYCRDGREEQLCDEDRHIVCYPDQVKQGGLLLNFYPMTPKMKRDIIRFHNECRNILACGEAIGNDQKNYPPAAFMRELIWDAELAYVAKVHAARCKIDHDHCRNTFRFEHSGQNLFQWVQNSNDVSVDFLLHNGTYEWFIEYLLTNAAELVNLQPDSLKKTGHFTLLIQDNVTKVGCAMAYCLENDGWYGNYMTCNYDYANAITQSVYNYGDPPASKCGDVSSTKSDKFKCLCKNSPR